jgi:hypothetical protein
MMVRPAVRRQFESFAAHLEISDHEMAVALEAGAVQPHVVRLPTGCGTPRCAGQLADEVGRFPVIRVATGLAAQDGHGMAGSLLPVRAEVTHPGSGNRNRATFTGSVWPARTGEYRM